MSEYRLAIVIDANGRPAIEAINKVTGASRGLEGAQRGAAAGSERLSQASKRTEGELQSLGNTARRVQGFLAAVFGAAVVREVVQTTLQIDGMKRTLEGVLGSGQAAAAGIAFIRAEADRLGVAFAPALDNYTKLSAAARGTPLAGNVNELTSAVLTAGRAYNLTSEQIGGALTALEQMISKGTVSSEELRGQLGERIPGAVGIAAKAMGVTTAELSKMLEKGEVVAGDFLPKFAAELERATAGAAGLNAAGPSAELARIGNELQEIAADVGGGIFDGLGDSLVDLREALRSINAAEIGRGIGEALGAIARNADVAAVAMVAFAAPSAIGAAITGLRTLGIIARPLPAAVAAAGAAFVALNAPVVGSTAAITAWQGAAARAALVGRGLFALIGGWPGLLALAAVGIYEMSTAQTAAERTADALRQSVEQLNAATSDQQPAFERATRAKLEDARAALEAAKANMALYKAQLLAAQTNTGSSQGSLAIRAGDTYEASRGIERSQREMSALTEQINGAEAALDRIDGKVGKFWKSFNGAISVNALLKSLGVELEKTGRVAGETAEETQKYIDSLREQRATLGLSRADQVRWEAAQRASKAATQELSSEILREAEALARKIEETEAATEAEREAERAAEDLARANARLAQEVARLADPLRNVSEAFRNFARLEQDLARTLMTPAQRLRAQLQEDLQAIEEFFAAAFAAGPLPSDQARAIEDRVRQATENAHAAYQQGLDELEAESQRFWEGMGGAMGDAFGDTAAQVLFHFDDIDSAMQDLGRSLLQIAERTVAQLISEFARLSVINPMLNSLLGTSLPTGGSMLGNMFSGQGGGLLGGLFNGSGGGIGSIARSIGGLFGFGGSAAGGLFGGAMFGGAGIAGAGANLGAVGLGMGPILGTSQSGLVGLGGSVGTVGGASSGSMLAAAGPWAALAAAVVGNYQLMQSGWGATGGSLTLPNGVRINGGGSGSARGLDNLARMHFGLFGANNTIAGILSGSAIHNRLFGRKAPQLTNSSVTMSLGPDGPGGSETYRTLERGGVFRSDRRRTHRFGLGEEAQEAVESLFSDVQSVMTESARALRGTAPEMINASLRTVQEYDSKGKVKSTQYFVDVLGRSWEEATAEAATSRITAEAMIATIDSILGTTVEAAGDAIGQAGSEALERGAAQVAAGGAGADAFDALVKTVGGTIGEASAIAERWRDDAAMLLEGAGFLLAAATDMRAGTALIADGSLTEITELVESLQYEGETLIQAYTRLQASTQLYLGALGVMDGALQASTAEVVAFAAGAVEAMGGLDAAAEQLNVILTTFFTDAERAAFRLQEAQARVNQAAADLGAGAEGVTFENYRQRFEAARQAGLTPEQFAQWVRLGVALAQASAAAQDLADANAELGNATGDAADAVTTGAIDMTEAANRALEAFEGLREFTANLGAEITAFGREGMNEFVAGVEDVQTWIQRSTDEANQLARAAGFQAASEETLTQIRLLGTARIGQAITALEAQTADLIESLYAAGEAIADVDINRATGALAFAHQLANGFQETADSLDPQRYQQALQIAQNLFNLGWATGDDPLNIAERLGLPFDRFVADLGVDLRALSDVANFDGLVQAARALGVELPELATRLGVSVGRLSDASSLLNDGFERALSGLTQSQREPIEALLRRLETAPESERAGITSQIATLVNALPSELRAQLAPFLDDVDLTPPEVEQINATDRVTTAVNAGNSLLGQILAAIERNRPPEKPITTTVRTTLPGEKSASDGGSDLRPVALAIETAGSRQVSELQAIARGVRAVEGAVLRSNQLLSDMANETRREAERLSTKGMAA